MEQAADCLQVSAPSAARAGAEELGVLDLPFSQPWIPLYSGRSLSSSSQIGKVLSVEKWRLMSREKRSVRGRHLIWTLWRGSDDFGIGQACSQWSNMCNSSGENDIYPDSHLLPSSTPKPGPCFRCHLSSVPRVHTGLSPSFLKHDCDTHSFLFRILPRCPGALS